MVPAIALAEIPQRVIFALKVRFRHIYPYCSVQYFSRQLVNLLEIDGLVETRWLSKNRGEFHLGELGQHM